MGPMGVGKSNFIDKLVGGTKHGGNKLQPSASQISEVTYRRSDGSEVRLVDTPGFDNTTKEDYDILKMVEKWLKKTYDSKTTVAAIIYLHRITDNRATRLSMRNLHMFGKLTGEQAANRVLMVTTMWDHPKLMINERTALGREAELKDRFWAPMIRCGARMGRFENTRESAESVLGDALAPPPVPLAPPTPPRRAFGAEENVGREECWEGVGDPRAEGILKAGLAKIQQVLQGTFASIKQLKPSFFRSLVTKLFGKTSKNRWVGPTVCGGCG